MTAVGRAIPAWVRSFGVRQLAAAFPPASLLAGLKSLHFLMRQKRTARSGCAQQSEYAASWKCTNSSPAGLLAGNSTESTKTSRQAGFSKPAASCRTPKLHMPALCAPVCALLWGLMLAAPAWPAPPNVVLITIDTVRADHIGCYGDRQAHTPTLYALAREGVLFRTAVSQVPLTLPSHCSIMTGTYPTLHGVRDNLGYTLGDNPPTLATLLKKNGYATAAFVGAVVLDARRGLNQGFDTYSSPFARKLSRNNPLVFNLPDLRRPAEEVVNDALSWMRAQPRGADRPFCVWIHLYDPHLPYDPPEPFRSLLNTRYDGAIAYADDATGKFLAYLREHSLYDPTLIIAASDHGESLGEHGENTHGYFIYDSTLLVPLIIKPPAGAKISLRRVEAPARSIDIAPTVLQFLGIPSAPSMQGSGLISLIQGKTSASPTGVAYCETFYPSEFGWSPLGGIAAGITSTSTLPSASSIPRTEAHPSK